MIRGRKATGLKDFQAAGLPKYRIKQDYMELSPSSVTKMGFFIGNRRGETMSRWTSLLRNILLGTVLLSKALLAPEVAGALNRAPECGNPIAAQLSWSKNNTAADDGWYFRPVTFDTLCMLTSLAEGGTATSRLIPGLPGLYPVRIAPKHGYHDTAAARARIDDAKVVVVPDVIGLPLALGKVHIIAADLVVGELTYTSSSAYPTGTIMQQTPPARTEFTTGTAVHLNVSTGLSMRTAPDLVGLTRQEAEDALFDSHLKTGLVTTDYNGEQPTGHVFQQSPDPGTLVYAGEEINLKISLGPWEGPDSEPPEADIRISHELVALGEQVKITVRATDNVGITKCTLTVNGRDLTIDQNKQATYLAMFPGHIEAVFKAYDAAGNYSIAKTSFIVANARQNEI